MVIKRPTFSFQMTALLLLGRSSFSLAYNQYFRVNTETFTNVLMRFWDSLLLPSWPKNANMCGRPGMGFAATVIKAKAVHVQIN